MPTAAHEVHGLGDAVGQRLVALALRAVGDEAEHPAVHVLEAGIAALREGAQQVERRRRLAVGHLLARRIGNARLLVELDAVDDVAAIARQRHAVLASRCRRSAAWRTGRRCGRPSPPAARRRRSARPPSAGRRGRSRGCCPRHARRSSRRNRRPAAGRRRRPRPVASCFFSLRASPAKTSGGKVASCSSVSASAAWSG